MFSIENIVSLDEGQNIESSQPEQISQPLEAAISFDWLDVSLAQRDEYISKYKIYYLKTILQNLLQQEMSLKTKFAKYKKRQRIQTSFTC